MKITITIYNECDDEFHSQQNVMIIAIISNKYMVTMIIMLTYNNLRE
jgi:hypothetical protein